ncbi:Hypothetical predicted protein, partial [Paramuricea clavata]
HKSKEWLSIILIDLIPVSGDITFGSFRGAEPYGGSLRSRLQLKLTKNSIGIRVNDEVHETFENERWKSQAINCTICRIKQFREDKMIIRRKTQLDIIEISLFRPIHVSSRMESGGFRLRKWKTNDPTLRQKICESEKDVPQQNDTIRFNFEHIARLISGIIVSMKILFQDVCKRNCKDSYRSNKRDPLLRKTNMDR